MDFVSVQADIMVNPTLLNVSENAEMYHQPKTISNKLMLKAGHKTKGEFQKHIQSKKQSLIGKSFSTSPGNLKCR